MSKIPPLKKLKTEREYRKYYEEVYCKNPVKTFDNIYVYFYPEKFDDAFFESKNYKARDKSIFSLKRAERIDYIKYTLENVKDNVYVGWDRDKKRPRKDRRVAILTPENYVVIITILSDAKAKFITAYPINNIKTALSIYSSEKWIKKDH